jgi:hypothetical protein
VLAELAASDRVTIMPRTTLFGVYDHGTYGALERVADHLPVPPPFHPAPAPLAHRGAPDGAGRRCYRAADRLRRQRPARHHAGRRVRSYLNRFRVAPGRKDLAVFTNNDDGWARSAAS